MSKKELERIKVLHEVQKGSITQVLAGKQLGVSDRQIRKLLRAIKENGDRAIVSKKEEDLAIDVFHPILRKMP